MLVLTTFLFLEFGSTRTLIISVSLGMTAETITSMLASYKLHIKRLWFVFILKACRASIIGLVRRPTWNIKMHHFVNCARILRDLFLLVVLILTHINI